MAENSEKLSEPLEDYLETIAALSAESGFARITDIAASMSVKKPSVSSALNVLAERGLVEYAKYKPVVLTARGKSVAQNVRRKHELLRNFFTSFLGVDAADADLAACKMEHALADHIMDKLVAFLKEINTPSSPSAKKLKREPRAK